MPLRNIKAVLFDLNGTLISVKELTTWSEAARHVLAERGVHLTPEIAARDFRSHLHQKIMAALAAENKLTESLEEIQAALHTAFFFFNKEKIRYVEGFEEFHPKLVDAGIKTCIATNAPIDVLNRMTPFLQFDTYFGEHQYGSCHVENRFKPDPAVFLYAAQQLGVEPHECVVFEDTTKGFQAVRAAGMRCIAILHDENQHEVAAADEVVNTYHEAYEALVRLAKKL